MNLIKVRFEGVHQNVALYSLHIFCFVRYHGLVQDLFEFRQDGNSLPHASCGLSACDVFSVLDQRSNLVKNGLGVCGCSGGRGKNIRDEP